MLFWEEKFADMEEAGGMALYMYDYFGMDLWLICYMYGP